MPDELAQSYTLGGKNEIDGKEYLVVRVIADSSTLFEEPLTGDVYIEHEAYVELRDKEGHARFVTLSTRKEPARKAPGPWKGIKPYFWKGAIDAGN